MAEEEEETVTKLLFIGGPEVGKTTLISLLLGHVLPRDEYAMTIEPRVYHKNLHSKTGNADLILIDCAGNEVLQWINRQIYQKEFVYAFVFDLTRKFTLQEVVARLLDTDPYRGGKPGFLIGMKADLVEQQVISHATAEGLAEKNHLRYLSLSSRMSTPEVEKVLRNELEHLREMS